MKHPFYSVSIDDIPFGDRIIAILLRTYLVRCEDAEQKLAAILSEGIVLKLPALAKDQEGIPLKTVLEGEHLAKLIDEAVAFVKADQTDHSDSDMGDHQTVLCAESRRINIFEKYCPRREQKHPRPDPDALLPMRAVFLF